MMDDAAKKCFDWYPIFYAFELEKSVFVFAANNQRYLSPNEVNSGNHNCKGFVAILCNLN
jgi:hypothetical protein